MDSDEMQSLKLTLLFYVIMGALIFYFNISSEFKSGPCTPNLDLLSILFIGPISLILAIWNSLKFFIYKLPNKYSMIIHSIGFAIWAFFFIFNSLS
jgi:hypothetical protein